MNFKQYFPPKKQYEVAMSDGMLASGCTSKKENPIVGHHKKKSSFGQSQNIYVVISLFELVI
jgi:hypothetical protein